MSNVGSVIETSQSADKLSKGRPGPKADIPGAPEVIAQQRFVTATLVLRYLKLCETSQISVS